MLFLIMKHADVFGNVSHVSELYYENGAIRLPLPGETTPIYLPLSLMGDIPYEVQGFGHKDESTPACGQPFFTATGITVWMRTRMYVHRSTERMANGR